MRIVLATDTTGSLETLRPLVLGVGLECDARDCLSFPELPDRLAQGPTDLVLVELGPNPAVAQDVIRHVATQTSIPVLAVGPTADPQVIIQTVRSGAREYLDRGRLREDLPAVLVKLQPSAAEPYHHGRTFAVTAATAGSGVTTVASSLAFALAVQHANQVVLGELGTDVPELALHLDLEPRHTVADLARDWQRMDATMVRHALVAHEAGVLVLAQAPETLTPPALEPMAMRNMVLLLRTMFDFSVLDLGHSVQPAALEAMRLAEVVVLVVRLDVPSLRLSRNLVRHLVEQHNIPVERIRPVANRYGQRRQVAWRQAEQALGLPIPTWIPDDPATLNDALNQGHPLVQSARRAGITRRFNELAKQLNGQAR
jgi:pilus assembly protein CpaE